MQAIVNNIDKNFEIIQLENKIQKTKNLTEAVQMIVKNVQDNQQAMQVYNYEGQDFADQEKYKYENIFINDTVKRLETECMDMMYNFLNDKSKVIKNMSYVLFLLNNLKDKNKVSETNFEVIKRGVDFLETSYVNYFNYVYKRQSVNLKEIFIKDIAEVSGTESQTEKEEYSEMKRDKSVKTEKEMESSVSTEVKKTQYFTNHFKKTSDTIEGESEEKVKETKVPSLTGIAAAPEENRERQSSRRQEVLKTLTDHPVSIKEISQKVLGCSEKTIQRELNSLLEEKIIRKEGEKRWSRYYI